MAQVAVVAHRLRRRARGIVAALNFMDGVGELTDRLLYFCGLVLEDDLWNAVRLVARIIEPQFSDGVTCFCSMI